jgi:hypothetical protein
MENFTIIVQDDLPSSKNTQMIFCNTLKSINENYLQMINGLFGSAVNIICIIVFAKMIKDKLTKEDIFKYLLFKSAVDTYISLRLSLGRKLTCINCELDNYYYVRLFYWIFCIYFGYSAQLISIMSDVASCFNRYRLFTTRFKALNRISYKVVIFFICLYSFSFYIYKIIGFKITTQSIRVNNRTQVIYRLNSSELIPNNISDKNSQILEYVHSIVRDGICVLAILLLNILTLFEIREAMYKKQNLIRHHSNETQNTNGKRKVQKAQIRLTLMVFTISTITLLSHGSIFIYFFIKRNSKCFQIISYISYELQYSTNFFFYLCFNLNFRKVFLSFFKKRRSAS